MTPVVTACNEGYFPGVRALHRSFLKNSSEGFEFHVMVDGDEAFCARVESELGVNVIRNPDLRMGPLPESRWYTGNAEFGRSQYYRLLIPSLFSDYEKCIYVDADALILRSLAPLLDYPTPPAPVAGSRANSPLCKDLPGIAPERADEAGVITSLLVFDVPRWIEMGIYEQCVEAVCANRLNPSLFFKSADQALLRYVLADNWSQLPEMSQVHVGHGLVDFKGGRTPPEVLVAHFLGSKPWKEFPNSIALKPYKAAARALWAQYG